MATFRVNMHFGHAFGGHPFGIDLDRHELQIVLIITRCGDKERRRIGRYGSLDRGRRHPAVHEPDKIGAILRSGVIGRSQRDHPAGRKADDADPFGLDAVVRRVGAYISKCLPAIGDRHIRHLSLLRVGGLPRAVRVFLLVRIAALDMHQAVLQ